MCKKECLKQSILIRFVGLRRAEPILFSQQTLALVEKAIPSSSASVDEKIRRIVDMNKKLRQQVEEAEKSLYARRTRGNDQNNASATTARSDEAQSNK